jgi:thiamine-phosphate pyrophosphorylase
MVITDRKATGGRPLVDVVRAITEGGATLFQLREKDLEGSALLELARAIRASSASLILLVNDRIDVALAAGADGVVLPAKSFPTDVARRLLGKDGLVGRSTHSAGEAERAAAEGCDFALFGPVHATPSKAVFGRPQGIEGLREASRANLPVYAVGGIDRGNAAAAIAAGAAGVAVIRSLLSADDPAAETRALLREVSGAGRSP